MEEKYDVVVVGGGAAGLSGALTLSRARRSVLVVDAGAPRNAPAGQVHNFLGRDGTPPSELLRGRAHRGDRYGGRVETGRVTALARDGERFGVQISAQAGERTVPARRLLVATGLRDVLPDVPGLAARWGIDVLHCPYCHGWEVRGQRIGILATGPAAVHQALLFQQLSPHVTLLRHTGPAPDGAARAARGPGRRHRRGRGRADRSRRRRPDRGRAGRPRPPGPGCRGGRAAAGGPRRAARTARPQAGRGPDRRAPVGTRIEADRTGATSVPGVWVAGNLTDPQAQVVAAAAAGLMAGAAINFDLILDETRRRNGSRGLAADGLVVQDLVDGGDDHLGRAVDGLRRRRAGRGPELGGDLRRGQAGSTCGSYCAPAST